MFSQSLFRGTFMLTAIDLANRLLGLCFQSVLVRYAGAESLGLLQMSLPLLSLLSAWMTAGIPLAISRLVAEANARIDRAQIRRILVVSFSMCSFLAICLLSVLYASWEEWLPLLFHDPRAICPFLFLLPVLFFTGWNAIMRGYFYGSQTFAPPAFASLAEQVTRILFLLFSFHSLASVNGESGAAIGALSLVLSECTGGVILACSLARSPFWKSGRRRKGKTAWRWRQTIHQLSEISFPLASHSLASILMYACEASLIPFCLQSAGYSASQATALFGLYAGAALPVLFIATVFTDSLGTTLVASVADLWEEGKTAAVKRLVRQAARLVAFFTLPFSVFLLLFARPLTRFLYGSPEAGSLLIPMAPFLFFICMQWPLAGVLQGLRRPGLVLFHAFLGDCTRLSLILLWGSSPTWGIEGILWAFNISNLLTTFLHAWAVRRILRTSVS
jgi:stage V sporulation protein B